MWGGLAAPSSLGRLVGLVLWAGPVVCRAGKGRGTEVWVGFVRVASYPRSSSSMAWDLYPAICINSSFLWVRRASKTLCWVWWWSLAGALAGVVEVVEEALERVLLGRSTDAAVASRPPLRISSADSVLPLGAMARTNK